MNKSANPFTLNTPLNIGLTATFTNGIILSSATNYLNFIAGSSASGFSNTSHVDGPVRKTGNSAFTFPVGNNGIYRGISISAPGNATDHFTAQYFKAGQSYGTTIDPSFAALSSCEYWVLDRTNGTSNVAVTLSWNTPDCGASYVTDLPSLRVSRWNVSSWTDEGNGGTTGTASSGTVVTSAAVTSFSPFTLASTQSANSLPVELLSFTAVVNGSAVDLNWATQSENNNDYFTIERSWDAIHFEEIGMIDGGGNNDFIQKYKFTDLHPLNGLSYYRLKQTDNDGAFDYLDLKTVNRDKLIDEDLSIYPNPLTGNQLRVYFNDLQKQELTLSIMDLSGKVWYSKTITVGSNGEYVADLTGKLTAGVYSVFVQTQTKQYTRKLVVLPTE